MEEEVNVTSIIIDSINSIFSTLFSSIDTSLYSLLDQITFVDSDLLTTSYFSHIFGSSSSNGILLIANSLILGFLLYYAIRYLLSHLMITQVERPASFLFKLLFFGICMNGSFWICERFLFFNSTISSLVQELGNNLFGSPVSFSSLLDKIQDIILIEETNFNLFSIDGILKGFLSISFVNLAFTYSIRYVLLKVFILISPFAFLSLSSSSTAYFFKSWLKCFLSLLLIQILVAFILLITFSIDFNTTNTLSKFLICGSIFALLKANTIIREFIGGISTDISHGMANLSSMIRTQ